MITQTEIFTIDFKYELTVEFAIDAKGVAAFNDDTNIEIYSINGLPEDFYSDDIQEKIVEEIRFHAYKDPERKRESQENQEFDDYFQNQ